MANTKSAQKSARQADVRKQRNLARKTAVKTSIKKVLLALENAEDKLTLQELLQDAQVKIARARGKGLFHSNTASRKIGRLASKVAAASK